MSKPKRCKGKTKLGKRCRAWPLKDGDHCLAHSDAETRASVGFTAEAGKLGGRPRLPRPHELMRERIEEDLERILKPYFDAIDSAVLTAAHQGEVSESGIADLGARIAAAERLLDRVYGKPKQAVELGGSETPIAAEIVAADEREIADAAHDFLRRLAGGADPGS